MELRVLHAAQMRSPMVGVVRQMEYEQSAADELGISWHSRMICQGFEDSPITLCLPGSNSYVSFKKRYYQWLHEQASSYDLIMLRYAKYDPFQYQFVRQCTVPVVTMHHTMEVYELIGNGNARSRVLAELERVLGRLTLSRVTAIAAVTNQIGHHQKNRSGDPDKPVIHYGNGAVYGPAPVLPQQCLNTQCHEFILLSSEFPVWMGLDLLFEAAQQSQRAFKVHVVGRLTPVQQTQLAADSRFVAHGFMDKQEVDKLMARCTLGLSTFGIHRKRFTEGNTLKAREYLRAGLPVYAGHKDVFDEQFIYHRDGPADFAEILAYADDMIDVNRHQVSEAARPIIEKKQVVDKMYKSLHKLVQ